ncbi:hypothetical protein Hanom_Chr00s000003g01603291 [Helianthus anomalus]
MPINIGNQSFTISVMLHRCGKGERKERGGVWGGVHSNLNQSHLFSFFLFKKFTTPPNV